MRKSWGIVAGALAVLVMTGADGPSPVPADFKILVASYAIRKEPVSTEEIIIREGRAYVFASDTKEVMIIEPARQGLELLDVGRKVEAEVTFAMLDESLVKIKAKLLETVEGLEKQGGKANAIEAKMTRNLFETRLAIAHDPKTDRVKLTNPVVEVLADGEPEGDAARLGRVAVTLETIAKLGAFRTPNDLPPFIELEAIEALTGERKLRPTELSYLYRLAGPPQKFRRTYRIVPTLTDREVEAISRVDRLREAVPHVRYERYRTGR